MANKPPAKRVNIVNLKIVRESSILYEKRKIATPSDAAEIFYQYIDESDREKCVVLCLDTKHQPTAISTISIGTLNSSIVHPREVFKVAILSNAAAIILSHNHPSLGDPEPSPDDIDLTKRILEAGTLLGILLLDHIIVGSNGRFCSLKEKGFI